jgi:uncharacterized alkaline shock family protein YloU
MLRDFFTLDRKKHTYALIGESGTGKSYWAQAVAQKHHVDFIIDDGLLVRGNRIVAGKSVKEEITFLAAVKAALFDEKSRRDEVARKLQTEKWQRILLLGTSEKMVHKIASRLQLDPPEKIIRIEDIASPADIETALRRRRIEGKHVIPVASTEVKQQYPGIFYNAIPVNKDDSRKRQLLPFLPIAASAPRAHGKTDVRPEYSKRTNVRISDWALTQMVTHCIGEQNHSVIVKKITVKDTDAGLRLVIMMDVPFNEKLSGNISELQTYIIEKIEHFTGISIEEVNIIIDKITEM